MSVDFLLGTYRRTRAIIIATVVLGMALTLISFFSPPRAEAQTGSIYDPGPVSADPLPTTQINGVAWDQEVSGSKVYVGGEFTNARPAGAAAGTNLTSRANLLAYNLSTGVLDTAWAPTANGPVRNVAASPDGSRIYVGGQFTQINGVTRNRIAALNPTTGAVITSWAPNVNGRVDGIATAGNVVYLVGEFSQVNGVDRPRAAAVNATTGAVLPFTANIAGGYGARGIVVSPDASKVVIAGDFTSVNGSTNPGRGLVSLDTSTGALLPWLANSVVRNADQRSGMYSISADADSVYATGWDFGGSSQDGFEGAVRMSWDDGALQWIQDCHGDSYDVAPVAGAVFVASHAHYCGNIGAFPQTNPWTFNHSMAFSKSADGQLITPDIYGYKSYTGMQAPRPLVWYPLWQPGTYTGQSQAVWTVEGNDDYVVYGGEFTRVQGSNQQGLVRFAVRQLAPNKIGPQTQGGAWDINATSFKAGEARVSWRANHDPDSPSLTYTVERQDLGTNQPLWTTTRESTFWTQNPMSFTDKTAVPGQTYNYLVRVKDSDGNSTRTDWATVTIATTDSATPYTNSVLDSAPVNYWPLNETSGTGAYDWAAGSDVTLSSATRGVAGQQTNATSYATQFAGTTSSYGRTTTAVQGPETFTVEAWFRTNSTRGGKIVGFGSSATGNSSSYDRHIYLSNNGTVTFGVYPGTTKTISSGSGYNNNQWHHVVGSLGPDGQTLYVDGQLVGRNTTVTTAQAYSGYWRIGGDTVSSWPNGGTSAYLSGQIADVAVYDRVLPRTEIDAHRVASGRASAIGAGPSDLYGRGVWDLDPVMYWRLHESTGTVAADSGLNGFTGTYRGTFTRNQEGALTGVNNNSVRFNNSQRITGTTQFASPNAFAVEAWIKTTTTTGGKIIGFGNSNSTSNSSTYDRHIYMDAAGYAYFGVSNNGRQILSSPTRLNDNQWHHVVGQMSQVGMQFFVDGVLVGTNPTTTGDSYNGYWKVGADATWAGDAGFDGLIDEAVAYWKPLTATQIWEHYDLARTGTVNALPQAAFTPTVTDLQVSVDAGASTDPDGSIAGYAWDFGDGATGTGQTATHTYATGGTYTVTLTVTDDRGGSDTTTHPVTVQAPNTLPTAAFTSTANFLNVSFDGSASTDPDGTIQSYSWAFGDGGVATGATASHTYTSAGTYAVSLTVTDDRGGSTVLTKNVTVVAPPNQPPNASVAITPNGLTVAADGRGSSDPDGTISSYVWTFGDGGTATGATASHTYASAGTYTIRLTVTDNDGATATDEQTVTVNAFSVLASDSFGRTMSNGWGTADKGGSWTTSGGAGAFSTNGRGLVVMDPSWSRQANLPQVQSTSTRTSTTFTINSDFNGGPSSVTLIGRQVGGSNYSARVRVEAGGVLRMYILRDETALGNSYVMPNYSYSAGDVVHVSVDVTGTSPTTVKGKVWVNDASEPTAANLTATDSTAAMQTAGNVGVKITSAAATVGSRTFAFDDFLVVDPFSVAPVNQPPVAAFTSQTSGLTVSVNGSGSSDPDGTISSYAWDFGDGHTATGVTASRTYANAGTYTVRLTVTDNDGASHSRTASVTVTAPPPNQAPVAAFTSQTSGLTVSVNGSGSSDPDGTISSYAWEFGDGATATGATASHTYATGGTYTVKLTVTDNAGATNAKTGEVTVAAPPVTTLAKDTFQRTETNGWGTSEVGGAWTPVGGNAAFTVSDGKGVVTLAPSHSREARLGSVSSASSLTQLKLSSDQVVAGGASAVTVIGRQIGSDNYSGRVRFEVGGAVRLYALRGETALANSYVLPGYTYSANDVLNVKVEVSGTNPTTVRVKVWLDGTAEPTAWQISATDSFAALQDAGYVAIKSTSAAASTNPATVFRYDDYEVTTS